MREVRPQSRKNPLPSAQRPAALETGQEHCTTCPRPAPQQSLPPLATQASNLFQSVVAFVGDGCGIVDDAAVPPRLEICRTCDRLSGNRCVACGCFIYVKARGAHLPLPDRAVGVAVSTIASFPATL